MTVKIVQAGTLPDTITYPAKCAHCKCEFTFNPPDAQWHDDQRDGAYYVLPCPTCKRPVWRSAKI